jgi:hypothetical protein
VTRISKISKAEADSIDESLGLRSVSVRLPLRLIADLKLISQFRCVAYQALLRAALLTYAGKEMRKVRKEVETHNLARKEILEQLK